MSDQQQLLWCSQSNQDTSLVMKEMTGIKRFLVIYKINWRAVMNCVFGLNKIR